MKKSLFEKVPLAHNANVVERAIEQLEAELMGTMVAA